MSLKNFGQPGVSLRRLHKNYRHWGCGGDQQKLPLYLGGDSAGYLYGEITIHKSLHQLIPIYQDGRRG